MERARVHRSSRRVDDHDPVPDPDAVFFVLLGIGGDPLRHGRLVGLSNAVWVRSGDPKPEAIERNMQRKLGLDRPLHEQYVD